MVIKLILFDIDKTLQHHDAASYYAYLSGLTGRSEKAIRRFCLPMDHAIDAGKLRQTTFNRKVARFLRLPVEKTDYIRFCRGEIYQYKEMHRLANQLHSRYEIGCLSNMARERWNLLTKKAMGDIDFDYYFISYAFGVIKPNPGIFKAVLERLGMPPGEVLFIDDKAENIAAARKIGMKGIRFTGVAKLRKDLRRTL